ncbi:MAG: alpha-L-rhamnosidase [Breznakibacter sp.]
MRLIFLILFGGIALEFAAQKTSWPPVDSCMKPASRWWWMGSAVDKDNLAFNISEYAAKGMGGLEITPIYGVQDNDHNDIPFLSDRWMEMYDHTVSEAAKYGMKIDMNTGTGWPFGGPHVTMSDAATKVLFEKFQLQGGEMLNADVVVSDPKQKTVATFSKLMAFSDGGERLDLTSKVVDNKLDWEAPAGRWNLIAVFNGKTFQKVKRAAPGGEGYVMDHFSKTAVNNYLSVFTQAFGRSNATYPNSFFNDSYEVYGADWTPDLFAEFEKRRGYRLEMFLPEFLAEERNDMVSRIISDYRQTLGELLLENFTQQWTAWANSHGSTTRNQAHGSPGNLVDIYAAVDIPECESFGISDFHIKGLRVDSVRKINDADLSMLKFASSAAHITGKPFVSSETFTWLTEHFRTSLSQMKPDLDLLFSAGVNHVFFHGTTYSPKEAQWPGWKFYASVDMSPTNSIWRDSKGFFDYVTRCQSFLQYGKPDCDFLLYFPVFDIWHNQGGRLMLFDIHKMQSRAPEFISAVNGIINSGYDVDYISDNYLHLTKTEGRNLVTVGGTRYKAIVVPGANFMPLASIQHLFQLAKDGATVVFLDNFPTDIPGFHNLEQRKKELELYRKNEFGADDFQNTDVRQYGRGRIITGSDYLSTLQACGIPGEEMKSKYGLHYIRRANEDGHHYFVSALQGDDTQAWIRLAVDAKSVMFFNPLDGTSGLANTRMRDGKCEVLLQLESGESIIIKTFNKRLVGVPRWNYGKPQNASIVIDRGWKMKLVDGLPLVSTEFSLDKLVSWTDLGNPDLKRNMGTALYSVEIDLPKEHADDWELNLGDVRESARLRVNGQEVAILWSVPFKANVGKYLKVGRNLIEVEVTNLPANRIADYDRNKVPWRMFKEINLVKLNYEKGDFSGWSVVPSGLLGPVVLTPLKKLNKK